MKRLTFTHHALTAIRERQLDRQWIELTVHEPEWQARDSRDPAATRYFRRLAKHGNRVLRVVGVESEEEIRIVTAFFDRRSKRPE